MMTFELKLRLTLSMAKWEALSEEETWSNADIRPVKHYRLDTLDGTVVSLRVRYNPERAHMPILMIDGE